MNTQILIIDIEAKPPGMWLGKKSSVAHDRLFAESFATEQEYKDACARFSIVHKMKPHIQYIPVTSGE